MPKWAIVFGVALIGLAVFGDLGDRWTARPEAVGQGQAAAAKSWFKTAWIPGFFGIALVACGWIAGRGPAARKHAMHVAAGIALLGAVLAGGRSIPALSKVISGDPDVNRRAATFVTLMAVLCVIYVLLSVFSFVQARRAAVR